MKCYELRLVTVVFSVEGIRGKETFAMRPCDKPWLEVFMAGAQFNLVCERDGCFPDYVHSLDIVTRLIPVDIMEVL